jgi:hypothetical protein
MEKEREREKERKSNIKAGRRERLRDIGKIVGERGKIVGDKGKK